MGRVWESVWGEWEVCWRVGKGCGEGNGEDVGKCVEVWGPNTFLIPHISLRSPYLPHTPSHFPTPPFIPLPTSLLPPPTPQHIFLLSPRLPSPSQSVAKLPFGEVTGNHPMQYLLVLIRTEEPDSAPVNWCSCEV